MYTQMETQMQTQTIDLTPTWEEVLPALINLITNPKVPQKSRSLAMDELGRMAVLADGYVEIQKRGDK